MTKSVNYEDAGLLPWLLVGLAGSVIVSLTSSFDSHVHSIWEKSCTDLNNSLFDSQTSSKALEGVIQHEIKKKHKLACRIAHLNMEISEITKHLESCKAAFFEKCQYVQEKQQLKKLEADAVEKMFIKNNKKLKSDIVNLLGLNSKVKALTNLIPKVCNIFKKQN